MRPMLQLVIAGAIIAAATPSAFAILYSEADFSNAQTATVTHTWLLTPPKSKTTPDVFHLLKPPPLLKGKMTFDIESGIAQFSGGIGKFSTSDFEIYGDRNRYSNPYRGGNNSVGTVVVQHNTGPVLRGTPSAQNASIFISMPFKHYTVTTYSAGFDSNTQLDIVTAKAVTTTPKPNHYLADNQNAIFNLIPMEDPTAARGYQPIGTTNITLSRIVGSASAKVHFIDNSRNAKSADDAKSFRTTDVGYYDGTVTLDYTGSVGSGVNAKDAISGRVQIKFKNAPPFNFFK